jgi:hypothetical protein
MSLEERFQDLMKKGKNSYRNVIEKTKEDKQDLVVWVRIYNMFNFKDFVTFSNAGFIFEYIEPAQDQEGRLYLHMRFRISK